MQWQRFLDPFGLGEQAGLYGGQPNPANKAMPYLNEAQKQYEPFQQQGQEAGRRYSDTTRSMLENPGEYLANLSKGYEQSPGYQFRRDEALRGASNSAAAGGFAGTLGDRRSEAGIADAMAGEDFQNWLQNVLGVQNKGLFGQQDIYNKGYGATSDIANILGSKGGLQFQGQREQNKTQQDQMKGLMEMFMKILPMMM